MILSRIFKKKPIDPPQPIVIVQRVIETIEKEPPQQLQVHEFFSKVEDPMNEFNRKLDEVRKGFDEANPSRKPFLHLSSRGDTSPETEFTTLTEFYQCIVLLGEDKAEKVIDSSKKNWAIARLVKLELEFGTDCFFKFFFTGEWGLLSTLYSTTLEEIMLLYLKKEEFKKYGQLFAAYSYNIDRSKFVELLSDCNSTIFDYIIDNGLFVFEQSQFIKLFGSPGKTEKIRKIVNTYSSFYSFETQQSWMNRLERDWHQEQENDADYSLLQKCLANAIKYGNKEAYAYLVTELNIDPFHKHVKLIEEGRDQNEHIQEFHDFYESYKLSKKLHSTLEQKTTTKGGRIKI
ncbi:hypothetical protein [Burkholderia contaminans]|uniref:hypothetical protein n=1 Tax=Burkholderia contaminans TaxID=488447 RepID=UPI001588F393|nr:hypothetical protein [Burkholderia contaminans]